MRPSILYSKRKLMCFHPIRRRFSYPFAAKASIIVLKPNSTSQPAGGYMNSFGLRPFAVGVLVATMWLVPVAAIAQQTQIVAPKNKFKVQDDVKLGSEAAAQVE